MTGDGRQTSLNHQEGKALIVLSQLDYSIEVTLIVKCRPLQILQLGWESPSLWRRIRSREMILGLAIEERTMGIE